MFWKRRPKSPVTLEDEAWIIESYHWFEQQFQIDLSQREIYLPTKQFLGFDYQGTEEQVLQVVDLVADKMQVDPTAQIEVFFFEEFQPMEFTDEGIYAKYEADEKISQGLYSETEAGTYLIGIEKSLIKSPTKLIGTIAHELAHIKLMGEGMIEENDEPLTDITAALFGFTLFLSNHAIAKMNTWSGNTHTGWQMSGSSGYLHHRIYAFLNAYWLLQRQEENPEWLPYLDKEIVTLVNQSLNYLKTKT